MSYIEQTDIVDNTLLIRQLIRAIESLSVVDTSGRQRVTLDSAPVAVTVAQGTATSLNAQVVVSSGTLTNVANIGGLTASMQLIDTANMAFNTGIRANLVVS